MKGIIDYCFQRSHINYNIANNLGLTLVIIHKKGSRPLSVENGRLLARRLDHRNNDWLKMIVINY